jgi:hypothetical protein
VRPEQLGRRRRRVRAEPAGKGVADQDQDAAADHLYDPVRVISRPTIVANSIGVPASGTSTMPEPVASSPSALWANSGT